MDNESINSLLQSLVAPPTQPEEVYLKMELALENDVSKRQDSGNEAIGGDHCCEASFLIWLVCLGARTGGSYCSQNDRTSGGTCSQHGVTKPYASNKTVSRQCVNERCNEI